METHQSPENGHTPEKDKPGKSGVVPNSDLSGSDADTAYNEEGEFSSGSTGTDREKAEAVKGSDADADEKGHPAV